MIFISVYIHLLQIRSVQLYCCLPDFGSLPTGSFFFIRYFVYILTCIAPQFVSYVVLLVVHSLGFASPNLLSSYDFTSNEYRGKCL